MFPDAFRKFFLTASDVERARRRLADHQGTRRSGQFRVDSRGPARSRRPRPRPRNRPHETGADAALIDTTGMTVDQVVEELVDRTLGVR